jgi:hypothetical protein
MGDTHALDDGPYPRVQPLGDDGEVLVTIPLKAGEQNWVIKSDGTVSDDTPDMIWIADGSGGPTMGRDLVVAAELLQRTMEAGGENAEPIEQA